MKTGWGTMAVAALVITAATVHANGASSAAYVPDWPYDPALDSVVAAPRNNVTRYEDGHVRFTELAVRPGETEKVHGHRYSSVFANDSPKSKKLKTKEQDPSSPLNGSAGPVWVPRRAGCSSRPA